MTESRTYSGRAWIAFLGAGGTSEQRASVSEALGDRINDKTWVGHVEVTLSWATNGWRVEATAYPSGVSVHAVGEPLPPPPEPWNATELIRGHLRNAGIPLEASTYVAHEDPLYQRVNQIEEMQGWEKGPICILQAAPPAGSLAIPDLHAEIRHFLAHPDVIRPGGFALRWHTEPETREGGCLVRNSEGVTWIDPNGMITQALLIAEGSSLGWYYNSGRRQDGPLILHPVALVETTLEFFRFVYQHLKQRTSEGSWTYKVGGRRLRTARVCLPPGRAAERELLQDEPPPAASNDDWMRDLTATGSPEEDAFIALCEFYVLFGLPSNTIPLVENGRVSGNLLLALRG